ncbi:hypothetical protein [Microbulbifer sp. SAOS-129_SWC]|uniref:hypothetical protein n=1 Tax=Microbulbifer sp. SAOS-129_SWC TaxID=3145235 RepID=UPI003217A0DD
MRARHLPLILAASLTTASAAAETLKLQIVTPGGEHYRAEQALGQAFDGVQSGVLPGAGPAREYLAIRCDGPWGAMKYHLKLASGPGYQLRAKGNQLLLELQEYAVISEDSTIAAMRVHCIDTEPKSVMKSLAKIKLERGVAASQTVHLDNGYQLAYHYTP